VGEGDCSIVNMRSGNVLVVDTGDTGSETRRGEAVRSLARAGVERVDVLVISHPHQDHFADACELLDSFEVGAVVGSGLGKPSPGYAELLLKISELGIEYYTAAPGDTIAFGSSKLAFLGPPPEGPSRCTENDASLVARLDTGWLSVLYTGDSGVSAERWLVERYGRSLDSDVLKLGHHGSKSSSTAVFLRAVDPMLAVASCGRADRNGHPSPEVVSRLDSMGIELLRTDLEGGITIEAGKEGVEVRTFLGGTVTAVSGLLSRRDRRAVVEGEGGRAPGPRAIDTSERPD